MPALIGISVRDTDVLGFMVEDARVAAGEFRIGLEEMVFETREIQIREKTTLREPTPHGPARRRGKGKALRSWDRR